MKIYKLAGVWWIVHYKQGWKTIKVKLNLSELAQLEQNPNTYFNVKEPEPVAKEETKPEAKAPKKVTRGNK